MPDQEMRTCTGCGRQIPAAYNVCPHCGRAANAPPQYGPQPTYGSQPNPPQPQSVPVGGLLTILLYLASFLIFPIGIVTGVLWLGLGADIEKQHIGKNCLILGIIGIVIGVVLTIVIIAAIRGHVTTS
jgi:rRNA maturation protein Nop10